MARLSIPQRDIQALHTFFSLESSQRDAIISILNAAEKKDRSSYLASLISDVSELSLDDSRRIVSCVISIVSTAVGSDNPPTKIVDDIIYKLQDEYESEFQSDVLLQYLSAIVNTSNVNLKIIAKSYTSISESSNIFYNAKIINDVRPIVVDNAVDAVLMYHHLKLSYSNNSGDYNEFYVALDLNDLKKLKKAIDNGLNEVQLLADKYDDDLILSNEDDK